VATLIAVTGSRGTRTCDASCYNAGRPECECVCGGVNHGKGLKRAQANTAKIATNIINRFKGEKVEFGQGELSLFGGALPVEQK